MLNTFKTPRDISNGISLYRVT